MTEAEISPEEKLKFVSTDGDLDFYIVDFFNPMKDGMLIINIMLKYIKEGKRKPFYIFLGDGKNLTATTKSRNWKNIKGNVTSIFCVPKEYFKPHIYDCAPLTIPISVIDYLNSKADDPECFRLKFTNDFFCDHMKKCGGIMCKEKLDYFIGSFALNVHSFPPKEQLRKEGILACCIGKHCTKMDLDDPVKICREMTAKVYKDMMAYDHPQQVCDAYNKYLYVYDTVKRTEYKYDEKEERFLVYRDGKEILGEYADGSFYDPEECKSVCHRLDYFEPELCNGDAI